MGEVFKARDTRLDRLVAIKVAKDKFGDRFMKEAHAIAALNHPNIATLYDIGPDYLVMEYVEGETLPAPLPAARALEYARQILDALGAAHRKGIVHRDGPGTTPGQTGRCAHRHLRVRACPVRDADRPPGFRRGHRSQPDSRDHERRASTFA